MTWVNENLHRYATVKAKMKYIFNSALSYLHIVAKDAFLLVLPCVVGQYMLMDAMNGNPGEKAWLKSPLIPSSGCLDLEFHYYLFGTSKNMEISVHTMTTGRTHILTIYEAQQTVSCTCYICFRWKPWTGSI